MDTAEPGPINQAPEDLSRMTGTFMRRWVFAVTAGETIGFMIPAAVGGVLALAAAPGFVVYPLMIAAGACEGALLGVGQSIGFGSSVVRRSSWVATTAAGAAVAWSIGPTNACAWAAGILWTLAPSPFIDETTTFPALLGTYLLAGTLMAVTVASLTGFPARRVMKSASTPTADSSAETHNTGQHRL
jgi:hypothetical protein